MSDWITPTLAVLKALSPYALAVGAVVAWLEKYRSSKTIIDAKEAQIKSLQSTRDDLIKTRDAQLAQKDETAKTLQTQIEGLKALSPLTILDSFKVLTSLAEERIKEAEARRDSMEQKFKDLATNLENLRSELQAKDELNDKLIPPGMVEKSAPTRSRAESILSDSIVKLKDLDAQFDQVIQFESMITPKSPVAADLIDHFLMSHLVNAIYQKDGPADAPTDPTSKDD